MFIKFLFSKRLKPSGFGHRIYMFPRATNQQVKVIIHLLYILPTADKFRIKSKCNHECRWLILLETAAITYISYPLCLLDRNILKLFKN